MNARSKSSPPPRKGRLVRRLVLIVVLLAVVGGVLVALGPWIASRPFVLSRLAARAGAQLDGSITLGSATFSWFGGQMVNDLRLLDPEGKTVIQAERVSTEATLWGLVWGNYGMGLTSVSGLEGDVVADEQGMTNLQRALAPPGGGKAPGEKEEQAPREKPAPVQPPQVPRSLSGQFSIRGAKLTMTAPGVEPVSFRDVNLALALESIARPLLLDLSAETKQGELAGKVTAKGEVKNAFADDGTLTPAALQADLLAQAADLPVAGIDTLLGLGGVLTEAIGPQLQVNLDCKAGVQTARITLAAQAKNLQANLETEAEGTRLALAAPGRVTFTLTPGLVRKLSEKSGQPLTLASPAPVELAIDTLSAPLAGVDYSATALAVQLKVGDLRLSGDPALGQVALLGLHGTLDAPNLAEGLALSLRGTPVQDGRRGDLAVDAHVKGLFTKDGQVQPGKAEVNVDATVKGLPTGPIDRLLALDGLAAEAIGPALDLDVTAKTGTGRTDARIAVKSANLEADLPFVLTDQLALAEPGTVRCSLTPALLKRVTGLALQGTAPLTVTLNKLSAPLPGGGAPAFQPAKTVVEARAELGAVRLAGVPTLGQVAVQGAEVRLGGPSLAAAEVGVASRIEGATPGSVLTAAAGGPLEVEASSKLSLGNKGLSGDLPFDVTLKSARLNGDFSGKFGETLALVRPAALSGELGPDLMRALRLVKEGQPTLAAAAPLELSIKRFEFPLGGAKGTAAASLEGTLGELRFAGDERLKDIALTGTTFGAELDGKARRATLRLESKAAAAAGAAPGTLRVDGSLENVLAESGAVDTKNMTSSVKITVAEFPSPALDTLLAAEKRLSSLLGDKVNADVEVQLVKAAGPVTANLNATHTRARLAAQLGEGAVALREPVRGEVEVTPELGQNVLKYIHPLLIHAIGAEQPIRLNVAREGFRIPTDPFEMAGVQVGQATLELGTILLENGGVMRGLMGFLGQADARQQLTAAFDPLRARVVDGIATYDRMGIVLGGDTHLVTWGTVDLVQDRLDMVLGLPPETMDKVFGVEGLGADDIVRVPITGPTSSPQVDWGKATAEIGKMTAKREIGRALGGLLGGGKEQTPSGEQQADSPEQTGEKTEGGTGEAVGRVLQGLFGGKKE